VTLGGNKPSSNTYYFNLYELSESECVESIKPLFYMSHPSTPLRAKRNVSNVFTVRRRYQREGWWGNGPGRDCWGDGPGTVYSTHNGAANNVELVRPAFPEPAYPPAPFAAPPAPAHESLLMARVLYNFSASIAKGEMALAQGELVQVTHRGKAGCFSQGLYGKFPTDYVEFCESSDPAPPPPPPPPPAYAYSYPAPVAVPIYGTTMYLDAITAQQNAPPGNGDSSVYSPAHPPFEPPVAQKPTP